MYFVRYFTLNISLRAVYFLEVYSGTKLDNLADIIIS